jgi:hypothetical protein
MVVKRNDRSLIKKLTRQVRLFARKEEKTRRQLSTAVRKIKKLGRNFKSKLANKMRTMKTKVAAAKNLAYVKAAANLERKMLKNIQAKTKALASAISKIEKKQVSKLTKGAAKKGLAKKGKTRLNSSVAQTRPRKKSKSVRKR